MSQCHLSTPVCRPGQHLCSSFPNVQYHMHIHMSGHLQAACGWTHLVHLSLLQKDLQNEEQRPHWRQLCHQLPHKLCSHRPCIKHAVA